MTIYKSLGMRIKYLRVEKGLSQEDLALEANINRNYMCDIEAGRRNPTLMILKKICKGLGVSLSTLFQGID